MYEAGFKDSSYYTDPETGQQLPKDSSWMKDPSNANVLNPLLSKYITSVMKDVHSPVEKTDLNQEKEKIDFTSKNTQSKLVENLIKKYSK